MGDSTVRFNSKGIALVEILIVAGIFGVVLAAMATMMDSQRRETRALTEKLAALDFQRTVTTVLTIPNACASIVNSANLTSGSTLQFNPAAITSTDPAAPTIIAGLNKLFSSDGVSVLADTAAASQVSPLARTVVIDPAAGIRVGGYRSGANVNYVLTVTFQNSSLVRPLRNLSFPLIVTTTPVGSDLRITGCQGASSASGDNGALCGQRTVFCKGTGVAYDGFDPGHGGNLLEVRQYSLPGNKSDCDLRKSQRSLRLRQLLCPERFRLSSGIHRRKDPSGVHRWRHMDHVRPARGRKLWSD